MQPLHEFFICPPVQATFLDTRFLDRSSGFYESP